MKKKKGNPFFVCIRQLTKVKRFLQADETKTKKKN